MAAPDIRASAYAAARIDRDIQSASDAVDKLMNRTFAPWKGVKYFDWPNRQDAGSWKLWLDQHDLVSLTTIVSGGTDITASVQLEPSASGPPFTFLRIDRASDAVFGYTEGVGERSIAITGLWAYRNDEHLAGALSSSVNSSVTALPVTPAEPIGVGSLLRCGDERMIVSGWSWSSTAQTGTLTASMSAQSLAVSNGAAFVAGEELLIGAERLMVRDIAGNTLIVQRAWSGSTLAAHTTATIYARRSLTVQRGAQGTTAALHSSSDSLYLWDAPPLVSELALAYALDAGFQQGSGYARTVGSGENVRNASGKGITELEKRARAAHGRQIRMRAV